jgi:hypothetical protein
MQSILRTLCVVAAIAGSARAQATGAGLSGVVRDSIARVPLAGAWVQLVEAGRQATRARTAVTDSLGRFAFDGLPDGRYLIGFFHPVLDSLGVEPVLRQVSVSRRRPARIALNTPPAARLRAALCRELTAPTTGGAVLGAVRDARSRAPIAGASVTGEWLEITFSRGGRVGRLRGRVSATTAANGWFALCNVPARGMMFLRATNGADSTDLIDVQVPPEGLVRRELFIGPSRLVLLSDSAPVTDTLVPARRARVGAAQLQGVVVSSASGRPLAGAMVRVGDNPPVRADERGAFTLVDAPHGTRMLEARAVGYGQARVAVDLVTGAAPVTIALNSAKAMLDTVKVIVARAADRHASGFEDRRRSGAGMFLTAQQIARRGAFTTSDIFRQQSGVRIGYDYDTLETDANPDVLVDMNQLSDRRLLMRGISGNWCEPALWFDGTLIPELSVDAIDGWVRPERLVAIEIYSEATVPPQFQRNRSGCGAILFWTK